MKREQLSSVIAIAFFAGTFVIAFTSNDSDIAAMRVLAYLAVGCFLSMITIFWDKIMGTQKEENQQSVSKFDTILYDAEKFSQEYGDVYVLADQMKKKRKLKEGSAVTGKPASL
ncbi:hypothetical protein [Rufibacter immobilis]|uniref:hypothetical protein n=1 Tax=Rufibacter immobilis TaxID=1348778 RepID=UPI0035EE1401